MSLVLDSREVGVVNFQDQEKKKDDAVMRGISCFFRSGFRGGGARGDAFPVPAPAEEAGDAAWAQQKEGERQRETEMDKGRNCKPLEFCIGAESESSESSSIGVCSNSSVGDEEGEVQSRFVSPLGDLGCLEESLPIKRGLSNYFAGKSKSFGCLSSANSVKDLAKQENPFNKRRRILLAYRNVGPRRASLGSFSGMSSQSLFSPASVLEEKEEEEEEEEEDADDDDADEDDDKREEEKDVCTSPLPQGRKLRSFMSPRFV
ncbi:protein OXIDATIVE STRESS 3 LIKE 5-like isoform X2 [Nymphaea colorata]|uniref:protein OXIDATIVE STRESS 3 LIKE 5-like isoform X2 n=1 Tax=Nymphaea colorata TaxID=210225 RepID=UPI00129D8678|nr:protein OXIDATIVE STRESS 3 LIKE 5-like isoform X2 [Nymphaea colorata]